MPIRRVKCVSQSHKQAPASVLLAVLCLLAVLSFRIITAAAMSREHGEMQQGRSSMMRARQFAESAIAVPAHPLIKAGDPLLQNQVSGIEIDEAKLVGRSGDAHCDIALALNLKAGMSCMLEWGGFSVKGTGLT